MNAVAVRAVSLPITGEVRAASRLLTNSVISLAVMMNTAVVPTHPVVVRPQAVTDHLPGAAVPVAVILRAEEVPAHQGEAAVLAAEDRQSVYEVKIKDI